MKIERRNIKVDMETELTVEEMRQAYKQVRAANQTEDLCAKLSQILKLGKDEKLDDDMRKLAENTQHQFNQALQNNDTYMEVYWLTAQYVLESALIKHNLEKEKEKHACLKDCLSCANSFSEQATIH